MTCGCGGKKAAVGEADMTHSADMIDLPFIGPDCTVAYDGKYAHERAYVVGRTSIRCRVFDHRRLHDATGFSASRRLPFQVVRLGSLCNTVVEALLASEEGWVGK